ncbi:hypothetical protein RvY_14064 [Ramazzottius varieornatus]|uniref:Citramalyl-CoA lyase, mitochondrial n=1 Tax=Ramazzottius varieornatus TaxID=947166 RepID=A0A1D1VQ26_RAMVA|nr:hypothetical protein RvY_14064 [Ramazzottius varieornatus]
MMKLSPYLGRASEFLIINSGRSSCLSSRSALLARHGSTTSGRSAAGPQDANDMNTSPKSSAADMNPTSTRHTYIPRRAMMYIPGDDAKKIAKIPTLIVDCPVLECEDGVALNRKEEARQLIHKTLETADWVKERKTRGLDVAVRINSFQSGLADQDLQSLLSAKTLPTTLLIPKIEGKEELRHTAHILTEKLAGRAGRDPLRLILYIESAKALLSMRKLLKTALKVADESHNLLALDGVVFGSDDYCADIGANRSNEAKEVLFARQYFLTVVKSFQRSLQAIDLVHIDFKDLDDLRRQSEEGARFGFTGKQVIHPAQVDVVQQAYSPAPDKLKWAQEVVEAFTRHQKEGKGAFNFRNAMIDRPLLLQAENIVAYAKLIGQPQR